MVHRVSGLVLSLLMLIFQTTLLFSRGMTGTPSFPTYFMIGMSSRSIPIQRFLTSKHSPSHLVCMLPILIILSLGGRQAVKTPVQYSQLYGLSVRVHVGSQTLLLAPDFASPVTRLYAGDVCPPFVECYWMGISGAETPGVGLPDGSPTDGAFRMLTDRLAVGAFQSNSTPIAVEYMASAADLNYRDVSGRLALGPSSVIAQSSIMHLEKQRLAFPDGSSTFPGFSIEFIDEDSEIPRDPESVDISVPIRAHPASWRIVVPVYVGPTRWHDSVEVEVNPGIAGVEMPPAYMNQLLELLGRGGVTAYHLDESGRLFLPCDSADALIPPVHIWIGDMELPLGDGFASIQVDDDGRRMCSTHIVTTSTVTHWSISPWTLWGVSSVFFDVGHLEIIFRKSKHPLYPEPLLVAPATNRIPTFCTYKLEENTGLVFLPIDHTAALDDGCSNQYLLISKYPRVFQDGRIEYRFRAAVIVDELPHSHTVRGRFTLSGDGTAVIDPGTLSLTIPLVTPRTSDLPIYTVIVERTNQFATVTLYPIAKFAAI